MKGYCCDVQVTSPETIQKTSLTVYSEADASRLASDLIRYDHQLRAEPLDAARILSAELVPDQHGYRVRHTAELVDGLSMAELTGDERVAGFRRTIGQIADMAVFLDGTTLATPIDAHPNNFHGGKLIDHYPPLPRHADGSMPLENIPKADMRRRAEHDYGQKTGAIVHLLATGAQGESGQFGGLRHALRQADDWCYDALPDNLAGSQRDTVRRAISMRFLPFIIRAGVLRRIAR